MSSIRPHGAGRRRRIPSSSTTTGSPKADTSRHGINPSSSSRKSARASSRCDPRTDRLLIASSNPTTEDRFMKLPRIAAAALAYLVAVAFAGSAPAQPVKNIVLVHGAFADGSSWAKVIPILQSKGYNVTAVQNPLTSLADDVAATNRALALQNGPVILVGHSWGGVVITEAGMDPKVAGLVYVAAFGPDS